MSLFSYEVHNQVAEILFNNPPVNTLTEAMLGDFLDALELASGNSEVRAVIIGSQVPGRFSAGLDLAAVHTGSHQKVRALLDQLYVRMTEVQFRMGKPTIAAVGGTARGGGMTIAISCDLIVASSDASFGYPEIDAGVLPSIHFTHLPRIVGKHRAFELLFTGRAFDAHEAQSLGLISRLTEPGQALEDARTLAQTLCGKSPDVVRFGRSAFMQANDNGYRQAVAAAADSFCSVAMTDAAREGIGAFVEKRKPRW